MALNLVPQPGSNLGNTRQPILDNFDNINNNFAVDHVAFASGGDSGKHAKITFPVTTALPTYANPLERGLYGFLNGTSNVQEINIFKSLAFAIAGSDRIPITLQRGNAAGAAATSYTTGNGANQVQVETNNYCYLPNGLLMQFMKVKWQASSSTIQQFPYPIAFPNYVFHIQATVLSGGQLIEGINVADDPTNGLTHVKLRRRVTNGNEYFILAIGC